MLQNAEDSCEYLKEENVAKVAKRFLQLLNKKSRELNITKIRKSGCCGNSKSRTTGKKKIRLKNTYLNKSLAIHCHNSEKYSTSKQNWEMESGENGHYHNS